MAIMFLNHWLFFKGTFLDSCIKELWEEVEREKERGRDMRQSHKNKIFQAARLENML